MKNKLTFITTFTIIFFFSILFSAQAQDGLAGMPGTYLHMGVGSEALSMGKAYTAIAHDATAIYWNPAALADQNPYQVYFTHSVQQLAHKEMGNVWIGFGISLFR